MKSAANNVSTEKSASSPASSHEVIKEVADAQNNPISVQPQPSPVPNEGSNHAEGTPSPAVNMGMFNL